MNHFLIFGTHPRLSLAEFKAFRPSQKPPILISHGAVIEDSKWDGAELMDSLGGTVKLGDIIKEVPVNKLSVEHLLKIVDENPREGQIAFGCSVIGGSKGTKSKLNRLPLQLKKALKEKGVRSRWVTSKDSSSLSPAAVAKLKLIDKGYDFVIFVDGTKAHIGLTTHVQNADAWSERDYGRPIRDDKAGMLPPKLARIMVNLARVEKSDVVIDPFCGSGTILMEAALATDAQKIVGSDNDARQITSTKKNNAWLVKQRILKKTDTDRFSVFASDARTISKRLDSNSVDAVITEGSLGPPLRGSESKSVINKNRDEITDLWSKTLKEFHPLIKKDGRLVVIWPSFKTDGGTALVGLDDEVKDLGYTIINPLEGWDESDAPLIYHRQGQKVARRIVLLEKS
jgi:tRNA G10  N-methylase Trm11